MTPGTMSTSNARTSVIELHSLAVEEFGRRVHAIADDGWHQPTPCPEWDVAAMVNHVVGENRWTPPILAGTTVAEIGDRFDGDLLGDGPVAAWDESATDAVTAATAAALDAAVHLSFGDVPAEEYLWQLTADHLVHAWDVARATGQDEGLDPTLVLAVSAWFDDREELYRSAGAIGPARTPADDSAPARLLARFGRDTSADEPLTVIGRFNAAFNQHDIDALRGLMTDDCLFVDTTPPRGGTHRGAEAVLDAFAAIFKESPSAHFETLGGFVGENRAGYRWLYRWGDGDAECVEGADLFTCRDGRVAEKLAYVKG